MTRRQSHRSTRAAAGALLAFALLPAVASATTPGHWDPVTAANGANIDQVATVRTPDGRLHVIWHHTTSGSTASLVQTVLAPNGSVGQPQEIASGWAGVGDAVVMRDSAGHLQVFAGATRGSSPTDPLDSFAQWTSPDSGATWSLNPAPVANNGGFSDPLGGALGPDGTTAFISWTTTDGVFVHRSSDPETTSLNLEQAAGFGCCGYDPGVALDSSTGQIVVAWYALINQGNAVYVRTIDPASGVPTGATARMPDTLGSVSPIQRVGLTGRPGKPGVFAAYNGGGVNQTKVLVWRVGTPRAVTVAATRSTELRVPAITTTPDGRLWAAWTAGNRIFARRSDPDAVRWGATTSIPVRRGTGIVYKLAVDATTGVLDVFGGFAPTGGNGVQTWHSQILAGLSLTAKPTKTKLAAGKQATIKLTVTDAGTPLKGATVKLAGHSAKTGKSGTVKIKVGPITKTTSFTAKATMTGYVPASVRIRVKLK